MTREERKLAATLLRMAADTYSNHGCNDFNLTKLIPDQETRDQMVRDIYGDPDYFPQGDHSEDWRLPDWLLMDHMALKLESNDFMADAVRDSLLGPGGVFHQS